MATKALPVLPAEIILLVIDEFRPQRALAVPAKHATTRTLLALTRASKLTCHAATPLLYSNCLYIDRFDRLCRLLECLGLIARRLRASSQTTDLPSRPVEPYMHSLYLAPYKFGIDEPSTAWDIVQLFSYIAPWLRRLVIDIALRSVNPRDDDEEVHAILRGGFKKLNNLEEFCSVRDELFLDEIEPHPYCTRGPVWAEWSSLRVLALYNPDMDDAFWRLVAGLPHLTSLIATRADGLDTVDLKHALALHQDTPHRPLTVTLVNTWKEHDEPLGAAGWCADDPVTVQQVNVPVSYYGDEDVPVTCQEWVKLNALNGLLETIQGTRIAS